MQETYDRLVKTNIQRLMQVYRKRYLRPSWFYWYIFFFALNDAFYPIVSLYFGNLKDYNFQKWCKMGRWLTHILIFHLQLNFAKKCHLRSYCIQSTVCNQNCTLRGRNIKMLTLLYWFLLAQFISSWFSNPTNAYFQRYEYYFFLHLPHTFAFRRWLPLIFNTMYCLNLKHASISLEVALKVDI